TMSRWFPSLRSLASHEVFAMGPLRFDQFCRSSSWRRRRLGSRRSRNWRCSPVSNLGRAPLFQRARTVGSFAFTPASCAVFSRRRRAVVLSCDSLCLQHAHRAIAAAGYAAFSISVCASLSHAPGLARLRVVWHGFWLLNQRVRHSPAPHLQRETL